MPFWNRKKSKSADDDEFPDVSGLTGPSEEFKERLRAQMPRAEDLPDHGTLYKLWEMEAFQAVGVLIVKGAKYRKIELSEVAEISGVSMDTIKDIINGKATEATVSMDILMLLGNTMAVGDSYVIVYKEYRKRLG